MRYLDSGHRSKTEVLGEWLGSVLSDSVSEVRWQTGYFSADALSILEGTLRRLAKNNATVRALIGSNPPSTPVEDIRALADLIGIPRTNGHLAVVTFSDGLFHPKTFHIRRDDGSEAAYVGSANLTYGGVALNVEAGLTLDSLSGDSLEVLAAIAHAIDAWFNEPRPGLYRVNDFGSLEKLIAEGVLALVAPPIREQVGTVAIGEAEVRKARLTPLMKVPALRHKGARTAATWATSAPVPREGFPQYFLFEPGATTPTSDAQALSGTPLPGGAVGLVIRLNRDATRSFRGDKGTANISIPVPTVATLKFGIFLAKYQRPRAEFSLRLRYLSDDVILTRALTRSNIMAYGYASGEPGHQDIRLEWPSAQEVEFRITFLAAGSNLHRVASHLLSEATQNSRLVGRGACWLPPALSPPWRFYD